MNGMHDGGHVAQRGFAADWRQQADDHAVARLSRCVRVIFDFSAGSRVIWSAGNTRNAFARRRYRLL